VKKLILILVIILLISPYVSAGELIKEMNFNDAAVIDVVQILADKAGLDLVISGDGAIAQNKRTSLHLNNIYAEDAVLNVLEANGLAYEKKGKVIYVSLASPPQEEISQGGRVEVINLKHLSAHKISDLLEKLFAGIKTSQGNSTKSILIKGKGTVIEEVKQLIESVDKPVPQVLIESKVLEIAEADSARLGLSYGNGAFKFLTSKDDGQTRPAEDLLTTLRALITEGKAKLVASPKISTLDNHEAIINIGSRIPYAVPVTTGSTTQWTVDYIDAGVKLRVTPSLGEGDSITAFIQPEVSSVSEWRTTSAGEFPVITTRNAQATLRVNDGETITIGGLLSESDRNNVSKIPVLGDLPLIGYLFQNMTAEKTKTEIVFLITPHII